jgi:hypothetical protein
MPLEPGVLDDNDNFINPDCMAKYIDDYMAAHTPPPPSNTSPDVLKSIKHGQRTLWIGVATGVIEYLKTHTGDSFSIKVTLNPSGPGYIATLTIL